MAWKRDGRLFSEKQKDRMVKMLKSGMSKAAIIKEVGCHRSCLDYILVSRFGTASVKPDSKELSLDTESTEGRKLDSTPLGSPGDAAELAYLKWALEGALNKVRGVSYVDRLIADIRDGRLG